METTDSREALHGACDPDRSNSCKYRRKPGIPKEAGEGGQVTLRCHSPLGCPAGPEPWLDGMVGEG